MPPKNSRKPGNQRANTKQKPPPATTSKSRGAVQKVIAEDSSRSNTVTNSTDTNLEGSPRRTSPRRLVANGVDQPIRRSPRNSPTKNNCANQGSQSRKRKHEADCDDTMGCTASKSEKLDAEIYTKSENVDVEPKSKSKNVNKTKSKQVKITKYMQKDSSPDTHKSQKLVSDEVENPQTGNSEEEHRVGEDERLKETVPAADSEKVSTAGSGGVEAPDSRQGDVSKDTELGKSSDQQINNTDDVHDEDQEAVVKETKTPECVKSAPAEGTDNLVHDLSTLHIEKHTGGSEGSEKTPSSFSGPSCDQGNKPDITTDPSDVEGLPSVRDEEPKVSEPKQRGDTEKDTEKGTEKDTHDTEGGTEDTEEGTEKKPAEEDNGNQDEEVASKEENDLEDVPSKEVNDVGIVGVRELSPKEMMSTKDESDDETADGKTGIPGENISPPPSSAEPEPNSQQTERYIGDSDVEKSTKSRHSSTDVDLESDSNDARLHREEIHQTINKKRSPKLQLRTKWSDADTEEYRNGYPGKKDDKSLNKNLLFYTNKIASRPDGGRIAEIHDNWWGDYRRLETHHGYIQWIFPIRERGMNFQSQELQLFEAKGIQADPQAKGRVLTSYKMMLDFYGMRLASETTGKLERAKNWSERYTHLNRSFHNYLRITRILKSLGELGYENLKAPFVEFVLKEAFENRFLSNCRKSCADYWVHTIRDENDRIRLAEKAEAYSKEESVASSWFS